MLKMEIADVRHMPFSFDDLSIAAFQSKISKLKVFKYPE